MRDSLARAESSSAARAPERWTGGFSREELSLYSRQMVAPSFGPDAQRALRRLRVLLVGAGGVGAPAALLLARAGVGALTLVDFDAVDATNLARQTAYGPTDVGRAKVDALADACARGGGATRIRAARVHFNAATASDLLPGHDIVVDASDDVVTRYVVSDAAALAPTLGASTPVPVISAAALGADAQVSVYRGGRGGAGCVRCAFPSPTPSAAAPACADVGVLGPVTTLAGSLAALEVFKFAALWAACWGERSADSPPRWPGDENWFSVGDGAADGTPTVPRPKPTLGPPLASRLLCIDGGDARVRNIALRGRSAACAVCGDEPSITTFVDVADWAKRETACAAACASALRDSLPLPAERDALAAAALVRRVGRPPPIFIDVRRPLEHAMAAPIGWLYEPLATLDAARARALVIRAAGAPFITLCRRGIDAHEAAQRLLKAGAIVAVGLDLDSAARALLDVPPAY